MIAAMFSLKPKTYVLVAILFWAVLSGCESKKTQGTVLAKVGDATLTLEDVRRTFPAEYEQALPREQYLDFVKRWIDDEVIYQQAIKTGLDKDTSVARRLADTQRKLLIEEFLARESAAGSLEPEDAALSQYYEVHREEFRRKVPEWRYLTLRVKNLKDAMELKNKLRGGDYLAEAAPYLLDPLPENPDALPFRKAQELRPCLQAAIPSATVGQIAGPLTCPEGIILVKILDKAEAGTLVPFSEVRDHLVGILMMERKSKQRDGTIALYKEGAVISFNLNKIPGRESPLDPEEIEAERNQAKAAAEAQANLPYDPGPSAPEVVEKPKPKPIPRPQLPREPPEYAPPAPIEPVEAQPVESPSDPATDTSHASP